MNVQQQKVLDEMLEDRSDTGKVFIEEQKRARGNKESIFANKNILNEADIIIFCGSSSYVTTSIRKLVSSQRAKEAQCFDATYFSFNVTKHVLVPEHTRIKNMNEKQRLFRKLHIENGEQLPLLFTTDPVAKYYGMTHGDICKVTRPTYISYRYVVEP